MRKRVAQRPVGKSAMPTQSERPPPIPVRQQHKQVTRQRVLDAGVQVFKDRGYADATIDDIVTQAAVGRATFYLHFQSKLDVMRALICEIERRNEKMIEQLKSGDALDAPALEAWLDHFIRQLVASGDLFVVGLQALASEPELTQELETGVKMAQGVLASVLRNRRNLPLVEAHLRAHLLVGDLQRAVRLLVSDPHRYPMDLVIRVIAEIWTVALGLRTGST